MQSNSYRHCFTQDRQRPPAPIGRATGFDGKEPAAALVKKVLVVDDQTDLADLTANLLQAYGLQVSVVYSADDALTVLENDSDIDVVFSDVLMPVMTGLQLADIVRNLYPHIKIILTSGYADPKLLSEKHHSYLFLAKPYNIHNVLKVLQT